MIAKLLLLVTTLLSSFALTEKVNVGEAINGGYVKNMTAWWFSGGSGVSTSFNSTNIKNIVAKNNYQNVVAIPNNGSQSGTEYITDFFTFSDEHSINFSFTADFVNSDGTIKVKSQNGPCVDIRVFDSKTKNRLSNFRIWFDSGNPLLGNHSVAIGVGNTEDKKGYEQYNCQKWIHGDAYINSSFYISFSKENLWESYVGVDGVEYARLDTSSNDVKKELAPLVSNIDSVFFQICSNGGWTADAPIYLNSINGQKFINQNDNEIYDDVAPEIINTKNIQDVYEVGKSYPLDVKGLDLLSSSTTALFVNDIKQDDLVFSPKQVGKTNLKIVCSDSVGNKSEFTKEVSVINEITKPEFTKVPTISDFTTVIGDTKIFEKPEYKDGGDVCVLTLEMLKNGETDPIVITQDSSGELSKLFDESFIDMSDSYTFKYKLQNSKYTTYSNEQIANVTFKHIPTPDFVTTDPNVEVSYADMGVRCYTTDGNYRKTWFGTFNANYSIDAKFIVPKITKTGKENSAHYVDMIFLSARSNDYWIMYRIWIDEYAENDSNPTNMYIKYPETGKWPIDCSDCGWISKNVGSYENRFRLKYDPENGFFGEFNQELIEAKNTLNHVKTFFDKVQSNLGDMTFKLGFYAAGYTETLDENLEVIVNCINSQPFENVEGKMDTIILPEMKILSSINDVYEVNETKTFNTYVKNFLNLNPELWVQFKKKGESTIYSEAKSSSTDYINVTMPNDPGIYSMSLFTPYVGTKGDERKSGKTFEIEIRSSTKPVEINIKGSYRTDYLPGDKIIILGATYSPEVDLSKVYISIELPGKDPILVNEGDEFVFEKPGLYCLKYYACDCAIPNPNELTKTIYLNAKDIVAPKVTIEVSGTLRAKEKVDVVVSYQDDSPCDVYITKTDVKGNKTLYQSDSISFDPTEKGDYTIDVRVEDSYGNITNESTVIHITDPAPNYVLISWIVIGSVVLIVIGLFASYTIYDSKKRKKGKIKNEK